MHKQIETILADLKIAAQIVCRCEKELLNYGFSKKETEEILKTYVYVKVNKED